MWDNQDVAAKQQAGRRWVGTQSAVRISAQHSSRMLAHVVRGDHNPQQPRTLSYKAVVVGIMSRTGLAQLLDALLSERCA